MRTTSAAILLQDSGALHNMPEITENFIHIPVRKVSEFVKDSLRTIDISQPRGIKALIGKLTSDPSGGTKVQKYVFDKSKWTLEAAKEWVKDNKSMDEKMNKKMQLTGYVDKDKHDEDVKNGILAVSVATDLSEDRDGEVVNPAGLDTNNFMRNPVLLFAHNYRETPIGKILELKKEDNRILFKSQFNLDDPRGKSIFNMFQKGFLNAFSIGFIPKEIEGNIFTKSELLEISAVPVPSNPNALVLLRSADDVDQSVVKEIEEMSEKQNEEKQNAKIAAQVAKAVEPLYKDIKELVKSISGKNGNDGAGEGASDGSKEYDAMLIVKRILQTVDKNVGEGLRKLKHLGVSK